MLRKPLDLIVAAVIAALNITLAFFPIHVTVIRIVIALPLVLVLPGYTLSEVLFRKRSLNGSERLLFSLGLSLAIDILGGLFLNLLPVGLQAASWAALLGIVTLIFSLLAAYLRRGVPGGGGLARRAGFPIYRGILFTLAIAVAVVAIVYAVYGATHQPYPGFTQLWILPDVSNKESCAVRVGVQSFESTTTAYRLVMTGNGDAVATWSTLSLTPQQEWVHLVSITPGAARNLDIEVRLYRLDKPGSVYREVNLTLHSCSTSQLTPTPYPGLARAYKGTIFDIPAKSKMTLSLTGIQQKGQDIVGNLTVDSDLQGSGPFKGMITATRQIHFTVTSTTRQGSLSFEGNMQSDGTLAGNYCNLDQQGQCSGDYGLWSVAPVAS